MRNTPFIFILMGGSFSGLERTQIQDVIDLISISILFCFFCYLTLRYLLSKHPCTVLYGKQNKNYLVVECLLVGSTVQYGTASLSERGGDILKGFGG